MTVKVKVCGLTRMCDLLTCVSAGADAVGLVCYKHSARYIPLDRAVELRREVPAFVSTVALFVNPDPAQVFETLDLLRPDLLQFHGDETPEQCQIYKHPYLKAFRIGGFGLDDRDSILAHCERYFDAAGWLFDSFTPQYGGSGTSFDHALLSAVMDSSSARPLIISGGLSVKNVAAVIGNVRPWAVDVSSGVEISPGLKHEKKVNEFIKSAKS